MSKIINFFKEALQEVTEKVSWPSQSKVQNLANNFVIGLVIATSIIGFVNIGLDKTMQWIYTYFK